MTEHIKHIKNCENVCQLCNKQSETETIAFYYWRVKMCKKCENKARKNGHIR